MKRLVVFLILVLPMVALLAVPVMAAEKKSAQILELEKTLAELTKPKPERKEVEKPCADGSAPLSFLGGVSVGYGSSDMSDFKPRVTKGAKLAGLTTIASAIVINVKGGASARRTLECIGPGAIGGYGIGNLIGQNSAQNLEEAAKSKLTSSGTGTTTTGGTLPPPPPPAPSIANTKPSVGLVPLTNADFGNVAYTPKPERTQWMVMATFPFKNLPFIE